MTQVSRYPLRKEMEERLFEVFWQVLADIKTSREAKVFFHDLLTPTERVMLVKRLGIALLLIKKYDYSQITDILKVSTGTIARIALWLKTEGSGYRKSVEKVIKREKHEEFWDKLEEVVAQIIPPRRGSNWTEERRKKYQSLRTRRDKRTL